MKKPIFIFILTAFLSACATSNPQKQNAQKEDIAANLVGIWRMIPLQNGIANVAEFTKDGESKLYAFNCLEAETEEPEVNRYTVDVAKKEILLEGEEGTTSLQIAFVTKGGMSLRQKVDDQTLTFFYLKGEKIEPLCSLRNWTAEKARRTAYQPSDFVPAPTVPARPGIERYIGKWANEKGEVQIEVVQDAGGSVKIYLESNENWNYLFNAVNWDGDKLSFMSFAYSDKPELYDHPYHKSKIAHVLSPLADPNTIKSTFYIDKKPYEYVLRRK